MRQALEYLQLAFNEQPLPEGKVCLRWTCSCGHSDTDLYEEQVPGVVQDLANEFLERSAVTRANTTSVSRSDISAFIRNTVLSNFRGLKKLAQNQAPGLPTSKNTATNSGAVSGASQSEPLFLLFWWKTLILWLCLLVSIST